MRWGSNDLNQIQRRWGMNDELCSKYREIRDNSFWSDLALYLRISRARNSEGNMDNLGGSMELVSTQQ